MGEVKVPEARPEVELPVLVVQTFCTKLCSFDRFSLTSTSCLVSIHGFTRSHACPSLKLHQLHHFQPFRVHHQAQSQKSPSTIVKPTLSLRWQLAKLAKVDSSVTKIGEVVATPPDHICNTKSGSLPIFNRSGIGTAPSSLVA